MSVTYKGVGGGEWVGDQTCIFNTLYMNVQPQAQPINYLSHIFTVLMLTSNTVSNHKSYVL